MKSPNKLLKKIPVSSLQVGMHLHCLDGSWFKHGLWREKFLVATEADRRAVVDSGVLECWIDTARGSDLRSAPVLERVQGSVPSSIEDGEVCKAGLGDESKNSQSVSFEAELIRAKQICKNAKLVVQKLFCDLRLGKVVEAEPLQRLVEELSASVFRNPAALVNLARLKNKDEYTNMHSVAVCALMVSLSRASGCTDSVCREAGLAGLLHDVGKSVMPSNILNKQGS